MIENLEIRSGRPPFAFTDASGNPTAAEQPLQPLVEGAKAVTNLAIGGNYSFSDSFRLHLGFFTDNSPVGNPGESIFRTVDLMGLSGGVSFGRAFGWP